MSLSENNRGEASREIRQNQLNIQALEAAIATGHKLLRNVTEKPSDHPPIHIVEEQYGIIAVQTLLLALRGAQALHNATTTATAHSTSTTQEQINLALKDLVTAIKGVQALLVNSSDSNEADKLISINRLYTAAVEALKSCFWKAPFRISTTRAQEMIPQSVCIREFGSPLAMINHYNVSTSERERVGMIPRLQDLIPTVTEWINTQNKDIFTSVLSAYTPLTPPLSEMGWLQEKSDLIDRASNFRVRHRIKFADDLSKRLRFGVLGLYGLGKSTLVNALIGQEILTTGSSSAIANEDLTNTPFLSAGWPIVIRHRQDVTTPTLSIDPMNFIPIVSLLRQEDLDPIYNPLEEPLIVAIWQEYEESKSNSLGMASLVLSGVAEIQKALHSIGKLVRAFALISRDNKDFQLNSLWPVIYVCMAAFHELDVPLEFLDLPGLGNHTLTARDTEAQWKVSLESCDAFVYTVKAEQALLDSASLEHNMEYLELSMTNQAKPWLVVATSNDLLSRNPSERQKDQAKLISSFRSCIGDRQFISHGVEVLLCSPEMDLCAKKVQRLVQDFSVPSSKAIKSVGGHRILRSTGDSVILSDLPYAEFTEHLDSVIREAAMGDISAVIKDKIIPFITESRSKRAMSVTRDDIQHIHRDLEKAASFCASWSVTRVESQREWHKSVETHLLELKQTLLGYLDGIWAQITGKNGELADAMFIIPRPQRALREFEKKAAVAHSLCELRIKDLAVKAWASSLKDLLEHLESHVFSDTEEQGYKHLQRRIYEAVDVIQNRTCKEVLDDLIQKLGLLHGLEPSSLKEHSFLLAHEGRMRAEGSSNPFDESLHLITGLPRDSSSWYHTAQMRPQPTSVSERVSYLERWGEDTRIAANGFEGVGFLVVSAHTPKPTSSEKVFLRGVDSRTMRTHLEAVKEQWYESMRSQSLVTLDGTLRAVSSIGIRTILDVFIDDIQKLEANINLLSRAKCLSEAEIEEVITAESNAICAWAALEEITK
ncbi:hypothetical protein FRC16_001719 [Serendipita sp. 398]|nr:hypothetical protein FRC16_001719 [Serendipita sp. 398]